MPAGGSIDMPAHIEDRTATPIVANGHRAGASTRTRTKKSESMLVLRYEG